MDRRVLECTPAKTGHPKNQDTHSSPFSKSSACMTRTDSRFYVKKGTTRGCCHCGRAAKSWSKGDIWSSCSVVRQMFVSNSDYGSVRKCQQYDATYGKLWSSGPVHFDVHIPESRRNFHHKDRVVRLTALDEALVVARCDSIIRLSVLKSWQCSSVMAHQTWFPCYCAIRAWTSLSLQLRRSSEVSISAAAHLAVPSKMNMDSW